jgi:alpha-tubulin suppressor-like RCC1 family protein
MLTRGGRGQLAAGVRAQGGAVIRLRALTAATLRTARIVGIFLVAVIVADMAALASPATSGATIAAWGENSFGQLGDGSVGGISDVPVPVTGLSGAVAISAGRSHTVALLKNGTVMAWGRNASGQLGDGTTRDSDVPVAVCEPAPARCPGSKLSGVKAVSAGWEDSLALLDNGTVVGWGRNGVGELGDGTLTNSKVPVAVSGLTKKARAISAGSFHSLALLENGAVMAWGDNEFSQLGTTVSSTCDEPNEPFFRDTPCDDTPEAVTGLTAGVTAISAGTFTGMALLEDGTVMTWGLGDIGELGNGSDTPEASYMPVAVCGPAPAACPGSKLSGVTAISAGGYQDLAILSSGTLVAWGANTDGQLGDGTNTGPERCSVEACSTRPVAVSGLAADKVTAVSGGEFHSLALLNNGTVMAWGAGEDGALGGGPTTGSDVPVAVCEQAPAACPGTALKGVAAISAGWEDSFALQAATPASYGTCVKTAKVDAHYTGKYKDKNCTKAKGEGEYEWEPTPEHSHIRTTDKTKTVTLRSASVSVVCKQSTSEGEITGPIADTETVIYSKCAAAGQACTSAGESAGSIKTNLLDTSLIGDDGEAWTRYKSSVSPYLAEFKCGGNEYRIKGSVAAVDSCNVNVMSTKDCETFEAGNGEQGLELEVVGGASEAAVETTTATSKTETELEINTIT